MPPFSEAVLDSSHEHLSTTPLVSKFAHSVQQAPTQTLQAGLSEGHVLQGPTRTWQGSQPALCALPAPLQALAALSAPHAQQSRPALALHLHQ